jgi:hypothetical protein
MSMLTTHSVSMFHQTDYCLPSIQGSGTIWPTNTVNDPSKDFMMPIIFACEATHVTSIFNQKTLNLPITWRTLGYINDLSLIQSSAEDKNLSKELKAERLYATFKTLLASIIEAQEAGALDDIPISFGGITKMVNLKAPVIFIIGDMQGETRSATLPVITRTNCIVYVVSAMSVVTSPVTPWLSARRLAY